MNIPQPALGAAASWRSPAWLFALALAALPSALAWPSDAPAVGNAQAGAAKAALCTACHGPKGISSNPLWPNLAGQQQTYLANQIKAFRDGQRTDVSMQPFVANLTDQDVADLAAHYASLSPCP